MLTVKSDKQQSKVNSKPFVAFAEEAKKKGFTQFFMVTKPKEGKAPIIGFRKPDGSESVIVVIARSVSDGLNDGTLKEQDLFGMQIIEGANADGEARQYLAPNGRGVATVDEIIKLAKKVAPKQAAFSLDGVKISDLVA